MDAKNLSAHTLLASLNTHQMHFKDARHGYENILKSVSDRDAYALLALGNDRLHAVRHEHSAEKRAQFIREALKLFDKVLRMDSHNVYAAHGMGICFALQGRLLDARDVFSQVREVASLSLVQISLAHVMVELGQYRNAIALVPTALICTHLLDT